MQIVSERYKIDGVGISMQGGRVENQDDLDCRETPLGFLLVVCDGMGGGPGGKTASYIVKQAVLDTFSNCSDQSTPEDAFKLAVNNAQEALEEKMAMVPELHGMGSTLVAVLIDGKSATVAHLGDSRCYKIKKNGSLAFRTEDHSLVAELVKNKAITEEQARCSPQSNVITRGLGCTSNHVAQIDTNIAYERGDRFVLCSDGVWGAMTHSELLMRLGSRKDVPTLVNDLSKEIDQIGNSHGGHHDNHTLAVIEMRENSTQREIMNKQTKLLLSFAGVLLLCSIIFNIVSFVKVTESVRQQAQLEEKIDECQELLEGFQGTIDLQKDHINYLECIIDSTGSDALKRVKDLSTEKMLLNDTINNLKQKIVKLEQLIKYHENNIDRKKEGGRFAHPKTAKQFADLAITNLKNLKNISYRGEQQATKNVELYREAAIDALNNLNTKSGKSKNDVSKMINYLKKSNLFDPRKNVIAEYGYYKVKKETQKKVDEFVKQLERIKKELK